MSHYGPDVDVDVYVDGWKFGEGDGCECREPAPNHGRKRRKPCTYISQRVCIRFLGRVR
jgi:hypothetical protein